MNREGRHGDIKAMERDQGRAAESDTEGHSMLTYELGVTLERERRRQAEQASKHAAWSAAREHRNVIGRIRDRLAAARRSAGAQAAPWSLRRGLAAR